MIVLSHRGYWKHSTELEDGIKTMYEWYLKTNLTIKRPGMGISPMRWDEILGTVAQKDYVDDDLI